MNNELRWSKFIWRKIKFLGLLSIIINACTPVSPEFDSTRNGTRHLISAALLASPLIYTRKQRMECLVPRSRLR